MLGWNVHAVPFFRQLCLTSLLFLLHSSCALIIHFYHPCDHGLACGAASSGGAAPVAAGFCYTSSPCPGLRGGPAWHASCPGRTIRHNASSSAVGFCQSGGFLRSEKAFL